MQDKEPSSGRVGALAKSYSTSAFSQTTCSPATSEMEIPLSFRHAPSSTLMKSSTGLDRVQSMMPIRGKPPRRPRKHVDSTDKHAWLDERRLAHHSGLRTFGDSSREPMSATKPIPAVVSSSPQQPCRHPEQQDSATDAPKNKQHRTAYSLLQAHGSLLMSTCDDSPAVSVSALASPPSSISRSKCPAPRPSCRKASKPISIPQGSSNNACRRSVATAPKAPEQQAELPSMFDIWDFIRQGAGQPISSTAAASIAAFSCDGPFSMQPMQPAVHTHAGNAAC